MIKKNYKGRCIKKSVSKSKEVCRTYNELQLAYLDKLGFGAHILGVCPECALTSFETESDTIIKAKRCVIPITN